MQTHPALPSGLRRAALCTSLMVGMAFLPSGRAATFTKYFDSSELPNNVSIDNVSTDGTAFAVEVGYENPNGGAPGTAIYYVGSPGGTPVLLADLQTVSPSSGGGAFTSLGNPIVSGSTVIFQAQVERFPTESNGVYIAQVGSGTLTIAVDNNTINPLDPTGSLTGDSKLDGQYGYDLQGSTIIFTVGNNLFTTSTTGGGPTALLPLNPNTPAGIPVFEFGVVRLAGSTYAVSGVDTANNTGIYTGSVSGGAQRAAVDTSTPEPNGLGDFTAFGAFTPTQDGSSIIFDGYVKSNETGLYSAPSTGGSVNVIALVGSPKPGGGTFGGFASAQSEGSVGVSFLDGTDTIYSTGLTGGTVVRLLGPGDTLDGVTVVPFDLQASSSSAFALAVTTSTGYAAYIGNNGGSQYELPPFFAGESSLGNGVYYLTFDGGNYFGYYSFLADPNYLFHFDLGYEYVFNANDGNDGVYFYDFTSNDFFYTSPGFQFPYLYDFGLQATLYYYPDTTNPGHYTTNPRYFFDFGTGQIITR